MITNSIRKTLFALAVWTVTAGGAAVALTAGAPAQAQQSLYHGVDTRFHIFKMDLYLTRLRSGAIDATGSIYQGNNRYSVKGSFAGSTLTAGVTYPIGFGAVTTTVLGTLTGGGVGQGVLAVATGLLPTGSGAFNALAFRLTPPATAIVTPPPALPPVPSDVRGTAGFGYTKVDLSLHFTPSGGVYRVSGQMTVHSIRPQIVTTVMQISGTYIPSSVPARFAISGAPAVAGNNPVLTGIFSGQTLNCQVTGIPSIGITSLYIAAK